MEILLLCMRKFVTCQCSLRKKLGQVLLLPGPQISVNHTHSTGTSSTILPRWGAGTSFLMALGGLWRVSCQLSCSNAFRAELPAQAITGSALVCCPDGVQGLLSGVLQQVRGTTSSFTLVTPGPPLIPEAGSRRVGGDSFLSMPPHGKWGGQLCSVALMSSGQAHLCPQVHCAAHVMSMAVVRDEAIFPEWWRPLPHQRQDQLPCCSIQGQLSHKRPLLRYPIYRHLKTKWKGNIKTLTYKVFYPS